MPHYLLEFAYTPDAWSAMKKNPQRRDEKVKAMVERQGGRLLSFFYCFGEYDGVAIVEIPDDITAGAILIASNAVGHLKTINTTRLLTSDEGLEVMRKASSVELEAPQ